MADITAFRQKRIANEISQVAVAQMSRIVRSRISFFEGGYIVPTASELARLDAALDKLIAAKAAIQDAAKAAGWPAPIPL